MNFPLWFIQMSYGATLFALFMGIISFFNGRKTRKEITRLIQEIRGETAAVIQEMRQENAALIKETGREMAALIQETRKEIAELIKEMDKSSKEILAKQTTLLERISDTQTRQSIILERIEARL